LKLGIGFVKKIFALTTAVATAGLLFGCSATGTPGVSSQPNLGLAPTDRSGLALSESSAFSHALDRRQATLGGRYARPHDNGKRAADLFVADVGDTAVDILGNGSWGKTGAITSGISDPDGIWVDDKGHLYVTSPTSSYIDEYRTKAGSSPIFTYSSGISDPIDVTTDRKGNVYEADNWGPYVAELGQKSNTVIATCTPGGNVEGVAIDKRGDVFVDSVVSGDSSKIVEYKGGLAGCNATPLPISLVFVGGMAIDKNNNLIVCDQYGPTVDVIDPPYRKINRTLGSGWGTPFHVRISQKNDEIYVSDPKNFDVSVLAYPSGSTIATLGSSNGIVSPAGAVDGQNFVP
jgi:hypothetical protein